MSIKRGLDRTEVLRLYQETGSMTKVSALLGVTTSAVRYHLAAAKVKTKSRAGAKPKRMQQVHRLLRELGEMDGYELLAALRDEGVHLEIESLRGQLHFWRMVHGHKYIRIAGYKCQQGSPAPIYGVGPKPDAIYQPLTRQEIFARSQERLGAITRAKRRIRPASPFDGLRA